MLLVRPGEVARKIREDLSGFFCFAAENRHGSDRIRRPRMNLEFFLFETTRFGANGTGLPAAAERP